MKFSEVPNEELFVITGSDESSLFRKQVYEGIEINAFLVSHRGSWLGGSLIRGEDVAIKPNTEVQVVNLEE